QMSDPASRSCLPSQPGGLPATLQGGNYSGAGSISVRSFTADDPLVRSVVLHGHVAKKELHLLQGLVRAHLKPFDPLTLNPPGSPDLKKGTPSNPQSGEKTAWHGMFKTAPRHGKLQSLGRGFQTPQAVDQPG